MRNTIIVILLAAILAGLATWWFTSNFEYRSEQVQTGLEGEARTNPYLAAERLIKKTGVSLTKVDSIFKLKQMPPTDATLFIPTERYDVDRHKAKRLLRWIRAGGHLVVMGRSRMNEDDQRSDSLLHQAGIKTHALSRNEMIEAKGKAEEREPMTITISADEPPAQVKLGAARWFEYDGDYTVNWAVRDQQDRLLLIELEIGKGWLTVLSDLQFMTNRKIGDYDHAYFTLKLFNIPKTTSLWLVEYGDMPSLLRLIRRHAWAPLLMLGLILIVYLGYAGPRLGPLKPATVPIRRSLMEHIAAAGRFLWRRRQDAILLQSAQQAVYDKITRFQPLWLKLPEDRLFERLAKISGQTTDEVRFAFRAERAEKELEFTRAMKTIQKIGNAL